MLRLIFLNSERAGSLGVPNGLFPGALNPLQNMSISNSLRGVSCPGRPLLCADLAIALGSRTEGVAHLVVRIYYSTQHLYHRIK